MHCVMHAFNNHVKVLHSVTLIGLLDQSAVLSGEVIFLHAYHLGQAIACPTYIPTLRFCTTSHHLPNWSKWRFYFQKPYIP